MTSAADSGGRTVRYTYDSRGNLATVTDGSELVHYSYIDSNLIGVATSVVPRAAGDPAASAAVPGRQGDTSPEYRLRVQYAEGHVSAVTLADGRVYRFKFWGPADSSIPTEATVIAPDGTHTTMAMESSRRTARENPGLR